MNTNKRLPEQERISGARAGLRVMAALILGVSAATVLACKDDPSGPVVHDSHPVAALSIAPADLDLEVGEEVTLTASATCEHGVSIPADIIWSSDEQSVAVIDAQGKVRAEAYGSTIITAVANSSVDATVGVSVAPEGTVVAASGGTVGSQDGVLTLAIPAGALDEPTDIVIEKAPEADYVGDLLYVRETAYRMRPEGLELQQEAHLRIRFTEGNVPLGALMARLRIQEKMQNTWQEATQNEVRMQEHEVEAVIQRLGTYALFPSHTGTVGPSGGSVTSADGRATIEVPAGALTETVQIEVHSIPDGAYTGNPFYVPGTAYDLAPDGLQFQQRARLRIEYDPASVPDGVDQDRLRLQERDQDQDRWRETDQSQVHLQEHLVEGEVAHFSVFAIVASNSAVIGEDGGIVLSADGDVELEIPAGALESEVEITIDPVDDELFAEDPFYVGGTAYDFGPDGLQFAAAARLHVRYEPSKVPPGMLQERLRIRERDQDQDRWRETAGNQVRIQERTVDADVEHFTIFAIVVLDEATIPVASVTVEPTSLTLTVEESAQLSASAQDAEGLPLEREFTWSSGDEDVATVSPTGVVYGVSAGSAEITAEAEGQSASVTLTVDALVSSVTVSPPELVLAIGESGQLTAEARGMADEILVRTFTWSSSGDAVAAVSETGLVTANAEGTVTITASTAGVSGTAAVIVNPPVASIVIDAVGNEPLEIGLTRQLTATAYGPGGMPVQAILTWASSDESILAVDADGLVTANGRGTGSIIASVGAVSDQVEIRVVGEAGAYGNNLSWPVVFADGVGITGQPVGTETGLRPLDSEGVTVDALPFFWEENVPTYNEIYYEQATFNTWQAEWVDGSGEPRYDTDIAWGDNLTHQTWSASRPIRVEQVLSATGVTLTGFNMSYLYGQGPAEMQGTDGSTASFTPTLYTAAPTLRVEKLDGQDGTPVATVIDEVVGSEVNVAGKIIYGYNLWLFDWTPPSGVTRDGWYRLTFELAEGSNAVLETVGNTGDDILYVPELSPSGDSSWLDVYVEP